MTEPAWLTKARSYLGFHEQGNNQGIEEFIALAHTGELGQPWCAIFANACLEASGVKGTHSPAAHSFADSADFTAIDPPRVGAISVFTRTGGNHVGFYTGEDSRGLLILGGNQGDSVCIEHHSRSGLIGFFWPKDVAVAAADTTSSSGRGSWYSQHPPDWHDSGDKPGSNALGVPDECQGVSFYNHATLGHWFAVTAPNGVTSIEQQTDIGPNPNTGRQIDISAVCAAERFHYTTHNFPTDGIFRWHSVPAPAAVAGLSPQQQADAYHTLRKGQTMTDTATQAPPPSPGLPANPVPGIDLSTFLNFIQGRDADARRVLASGVAVFNALHPDAPIVLGGAPASLPATANLAPATGVLQRPSVQLGALGLGLSTLLQTLGVVGMPAGPGATTAGTLATLVPTLIAGVGATGGWTSMLKGAGALLKLLVPK